MKAVALDLSNSLFRCFSGLPSLAPDVGSFRSAVGELPGPVVCEFAPLEGPNFDQTIRLRLIGPGATHPTVLHRPGSKS